MRRVKSLPSIPTRSPAAHKGDFGKIVIIAGSWGMAGAAYLACKGAYRSGAGLVYLCAPDILYNSLAAKLTCTVIHPLPSTREGGLALRALPKILKLASGCDAMAVGPGLSQARQTGQLLYRLIPKLRIPCVVDADGLNLIAKSPEVLLSSKAPIVITPHPGELSRIILTPVSQIQKERARIASSVAIRHKLTVVLKGYRTIVTDGDKVYENRSGNPGMATGGSGDVLTGMIATFLGQGFKPFEAASLGVYLHGLAGDLAAKKFGQISMIATDILDSLPTAITKFQRTQQNP